MAQSDTLRIRRMFGGDRLALAREFNGWSKEQLGREADVTGAAIGQFERGTTTPNTATLDRLAETLNVPVEFFAVDADTGTEMGAYFRSLRSTTLTQRRRARAFVQYVHQLVTALEQIVVLPECHLDRRPVDPSSKDYDAIEEIAAATRRSWGLDPHAPLPNAVRQLETNGILVVRNYQGDAKVDAFSVPFRDRSLVVLSTAKGKHDRSRFDVAHELGHLVMHTPDHDDTKLVETQAHRFAGAFLMPADGIRDELPTTHRNVPALLRLKQKWGASVAAILRRSLDLERMTPEQYTNAMKALSAKGWRRNEPGDLRPEEPTLLRRAIEVADEAGYGIEELAGQAALSPAFIEQLIEEATDPRRTVTF